uniref:Chromosome 18 open reading frame 25 n=1 Tax=Neogobius melanostomus TaxID=47308 RepID=A0A8C6WUQ7_9GOBI
MKMADSGKTDEFVDAECPTECLDEANAAAGQEEQEEECRSETSTSITSTQREKEGDSLLQTESEQSLLSMPCLMKELRRDSAGSQQASSGGDKAVSSRAYESDSSNPCMLSPSSSGHLADSDTLSSGDEVADAPVGEDEDNMEALLDSEQTADKPTSSTTGVRKSRRSRSESDAPSNAMAAKKNRCQTTTDAATGQEKQTNGKVGKVKGHRSQKHKERMRLLRQKREAAARKKYNLLQDSSTSDSEVTCDSSTSSSDDDDETSGGSKTIKTDIPDGPPVVGHYDISGSDSNPESMNVEAARPSVIRHELKTHRGQVMAVPSGCIRALSSLSGNAEAQLLHKESSQHKGQISITSSDSEVEIVDVQEKARCSHPYGGVIKSLSSWKENPVNQITSTNQSQLWTSVSPQPNWVSPPEVVDLTLDEETGHKYLL